MTLTSALTDRLKEPRLIAAGGFINGKWNTVSSRGKIFRPTRRMRRSMLLMRHSRAGQQNRQRSAPICSKNSTG